MNRDAIQSSSKIRWENDKITNSLNCRLTDSSPPLHGAWKTIASEKSLKLRSSRENRRGKCSREGAKAQTLFTGWKLIKIGKTAAAATGAARASIGVESLIPHRQNFTSSERAIDRSSILTFLPPPQPSPFFSGGGTRELDGVFYELFIPFPESRISATFSLIKKFPSSCPSGCLSRSPPPRPYRARCGVQTGIFIIKKYYSWPKG